MVYKIVHLFFIFFSIFVMAEDRPVPKKICPSINNYRWNYSDITKREDLRVFCFQKMAHPLSDFLPQGSDCSINQDEIICKDHKSNRQLRICLGVPGISEWTVRYDQKEMCVRKSLHPLVDKIGSDYKCSIRNQGILCLPNDFDVEGYFPSKIKKVEKVVVKDLNCPDGAEALADVDRIFCFYKTKVETCDFPNFRTSYQSEPICARVKGYYTHVWYFKK